MAEQLTMVAAAGDNGRGRDPGRRAGDYVTFREISQLLGEQAEREYSMRAELAIQTNNTIERMEKRFSDWLQTIDDRLTAHDRQHLELLQKTLDRQPIEAAAREANKLQRAAVVVAAVALVVAAALQVAGFIIHH